MRCLTKLSETVESLQGFTICAECLEVCGVLKLGRNVCAIPLKVCGVKKTSYNLA